MMVVDHPKEEECKLTKSICRLCKGVGERLLLKGERCLSPKCPMKKTPMKKTPGRKKSIMRTSRKLSDYGLRLKEKQKLKSIYGLNEKQFKRFFHIAQSQKGATGEILLSLLERRLDNIVFRLGFANSRRHARQLVSHQFFQVGEKKINIPSCLLKEGEMIEVRKGKIESLKKSISKEGEEQIPSWLSSDKDKFKGKMLRIPERGEISIPVQEKLVVELYSR